MLETVRRGLQAFIGGHQFQIGNPINRLAIG